MKGGHDHRIKKVKSGDQKMKLINYSVMMIVQKQKTQSDEAVQCPVQATAALKMVPVKSY